MRAYEILLQHDDDTPPTHPKQTKSRSVRFGVVVVVVVVW
jgi:hypothetical protein